MMPTSTLPYSLNYAKTLQNWLCFCTAVFSLLFAWHSQVALAVEQTTSNAIAFKLLSSEDQQIHYAYAGNPQKPGVLFIHGTPGDWSAFESYLTNLQLQDEFFMISLDRPQWGDSKLLSNQNPNLFATQVSAIELILAQHPKKQWTLVGHSLGASIAPAVALANPASISGLLLMAGSLDPALGKPRWFNHIANNMLLKWFVPRKLRSSNQEIMQLREELRLMETELSEVTLNTRVTVIQGMRDRLVSPKNSHYVQENWSAHFKQISVIELEDEGHFLPWRQSELVIQQIQLLSIAQ